LSAARTKKPGFPLQVLGSANALPVGFPLQSLARAPAAKKFLPLSQISRRSFGWLDLFFAFFFFASSALPVFDFAVKKFCGSGIAQADGVLNPFAGINGTALEENSRASAFTAIMKNKLREAQQARGAQGIPGAR
jgi:hypothetical protein